MIRLLLEYADSRKRQTKGLARHPVQLARLADLKLKEQALDKLKPAHGPGGSSHGGYIPLRCCVRGLRITVWDVPGWLGAGMTEDEILDEHPDLEKADFPAVYRRAGRTSAISD